MKNLSSKFIDLLRNVKNKRPRVVIEHIIKHGQITTEELKIYMAITIRHGRREMCVN